MNYYYYDACHYCFESDSLPDRCPDCGKVQHTDRPAVRLATENEVADLLCARAADEAEPIFSACG